MMTELYRHDPVLYAIFVEGRSFPHKTHLEKAENATPCRNQNPGPLGEQTPQGRSASWFGALRERVKAWMVL